MVFQSFFVAGVASFTVGIVVDVASELLPTLAVLAHLLH